MNEANKIIENISTMIIDPIIYLLLSLGLLIFTFGLVEFISDPMNTSKKELGRKHMIYGILGLLIMVSIWGITALVTNTLGLSCKGLSEGQPCTYRPH